MPVPNIYEDTTATHGVGALSVPWGTHNDTFCAVLVVTCAGEGTLGTPTQSGSDGTWTLIASCAEGSGAGSIQIAAYWCRATSGSMSNVTVPDTGDHTSAKMFMIQNVVSSGNPINMYATQTVATATASISMAAPNTTVQNCLVFMLAGCAFDQTTSPGGSGWANSGLDSIGFAGQYCTNNGTGGGYMGAAGAKAVAGTCGTFSHTWASGSTKQANIIFAISDTATTGGSAASGAGTSTVTGTGNAIAAGAGASAGTGSATATASDGTYGQAAGTGAATGVGGSIATGAGSAAGVGAATASAVEYRLIDVTSIPQTIASGSWAIPAFEAKWKVMLTMTFASGNAAYSGYHGIITSGTASGYGLWLNGSNIEVVDTNDNILGSYACTWSAGQNITLMPDFVAGTLTISGATTGNGVQTFTPSAPHWESGSALYIGGWAGNATWNLAATIGDIFAVVTGGGGSATGTGSATATGASIAAGAGAAAGVGAASAVGEQSNPDFELGAVISARLLFGSAQTSITTAAVNTQSSGSTIVICTGGLLTDLATAPTDNKGNTYTALGAAEEFNDWPGYGIRMWRCIGATGGTSHTFTQTQTEFEEVSIVVVEITDALWIEDEAIIERAEGSSLVSPSVTSLAEAHWILFWCGDAPTGATTVVTPDNGHVIIDDDTAVDHPNGYVPIIASHAYKSTAGTYSSTGGITPTQGAIIGAVVVQRAQIAESPGSAAGTGSATATGAAVTAAAGTSAGTSDAAAGGASTATATGAGAGTGSATAVGQAVTTGAGSSDGQGSATAGGASVAAASGAAAGVGAATAGGAATSAAAGAASGAGDANATGGSVAAAAGAGAGVGTATGAGQAIISSGGSAGGTSDGTAGGASTATAAAQADGVANATGGGNAIVASAGSATGAGNAAASGAVIAAGTGAADGGSSVTGAAPGVSQGAGAADGSSQATGAGNAIAAGGGNAAGAGTAAATGQGVTTASGSASGGTTADAVGGATAAGAATTAGSTNAAATGGAVAAGAGSAAGAGTATGAAYVGDGGAGAATGSANVQGASATIAAATGSAAGSSTATAQSEETPEVEVTRLRGTARHTTVLKAIIPR